MFPLCAASPAPRLSVRSAIFSCLRTSSLTRAPFARAARNMHARARTYTTAQAWRQLREQTSLWTDLVVHGKAAKFDGYFPHVSAHTTYNVRVLEISLSFARALLFPPPPPPLSLSLVFSLSLARSLPFFLSASLSLSFSISLSRKFLSPPPPIIVCEF